STTYYFDSFDDDREPWQEAAFSLTRRTPVGCDLPRHPGGAVRRRRPAFRRRVLPALPPRHLCLHRRRRRDDERAVSRISRRLRSLPVARPRLGGLRRRALPRLRHADEDLRRHRIEVRRQLDADRQGLLRPRRTELRVELQLVLRRV